MKECLTQDMPVPEALADPLDERYAGPDPKGTTGAGYGELNGAKPLTEPWHTR